MSALVKLRLGGMVDEKGRLRGGEESWCCAQCHRPYFKIQAFPA